MSKVRAPRTRRAAPEAETAPSAPQHVCQPGKLCLHSSHDHELHAARGVVPVWMAAVMATLSFALLATLASNAYAQNVAASDPSASNAKLLRQMSARMERMEAQLNAMNEAKAAAEPTKK